MKFDSAGYLDNEEYSRMTQATDRLQSEDFISKETSSVFCLINFIIMSPLIALFGIFTNIINIIVFYRQGFNTTTNISFFALAISDMGCLLTVQCVVIFLNPYLEKADIQFVPGEVLHVSGGWQHVCFCRITSWITVFITAERCLGITLPLKVKQIITLRRTTITLCAIFAGNLSTLLPEYVIVYLDWKFIPSKNRSLLGLVYRSYKGQAYGLAYTLTSVSGIISYISVIVLTFFLVTKLAQKSKWRKVATGGTDNSKTLPSRDKKTMTMIVMIASVLIVCHIPGTAVSLASTFVPKFMIGQAFANSYFVFWSIAFVFNIINSSANVFLYYPMSSTYRKSFNDLFPRCSTTNEQLIDNVAQR